MVYTDHFSYTWVLLVACRNVLRHHQSNKVFLVLADRAVIIASQQLEYITIITGNVSTIFRFDNMSWAYNHRYGNIKSSAFYRPV